MRIFRRMIEGMEREITKFFGAKFFTNKVVRQSMKFEECRPRIWIARHFIPENICFLNHTIEVNATGTLNLLEAARQYVPESSFVQMSTNKVYGDAPNELPIVELETRYDYEGEDFFHGIDENCRVDMWDSYL